MGNMSHRALALLIPMLAVLVIATYAGGLGVIFMLLFETPAHEWAVVTLGLILIIGVPTTAYLLQQRVERNGG
ncbi:MAG: hypothetical protein L0177_02870 [Chloroflexi bacterium]|nr:hypothetical protein [Chloroflexota bacterium]